MLSVFQLFLFFVIFLYNCRTYIPEAVHSRSHRERLFSLYGFKVDVSLKTDQKMSLSVFAGHDYITFCIGPAQSLNNIF